MLNPSNDRLDYGQILAPPAEYYIDFAIGTTYSLNLDALVGASLALGLSAETDSDLMNNPVCLLEALRSTGDNVALFCEGGQIHMPNRPTPLYILLEKMVFPVKTPKRRGLSSYPSFHPKFWLIRYRNEEDDVIYRVIILSRNLTFDHSWDVSYCMDGVVKGRKLRKNQPVCDFLQYLLTQIPRDENGKEKARRIRSIIRELPYVVFTPPEKEFKDFEFLPVGVRNESGGYYDMEDTPLFSGTFHEIFVMSPFVNGSVIRSFNNRNDGYGFTYNKHMLITRKTSLSYLKAADVSNFQIYAMRDNVIDGESAISDDTESVQSQDIHAKLYMMRKHSDTDLYLGSLNATHNAMHGNVEFMIRLKSTNRYLNIDRLTASLFGSDKDGKDNPFEEVKLVDAAFDEGVDKSYAMDAAVKGINRSNPEAKVQEINGLYSVAVCFGACDTKGFSVQVRPLLSRKTAEFAQSISFENLEMTQLSEFYVITVIDGEDSIDRVIVIPTTGLPEDREKAVVTSVVSNRECFYRYIAFLLGDDEIMSILESNEAEVGLGSASASAAYQIPALYEKMLRTAATAPEKFKGIEYLIKTISDDGIIPEDFKRLYDTFKKAVKL